MNLIRTELREVFLVILINDYLYNILDVFQKYIGSFEYLCDLKGVHFDGGC